MDFEFEDVALPNETPAVANAVNNHGAIVGVFLSEDERVAGFRLDDSDFETIEIEGARATFAQDISDSGIIAGDFVDDDGRSRGFCFAEGSSPWSTFQGPSRRSYRE